jgi:cephalosporin hydroxylase
VTTSNWGYRPEEIAACVQAFGDWHTADLWKHNADLNRYERIIRETRPDVIIETGTGTGASASWMSGQCPVHPYVITIDTDSTRWNRASQPEKVHRYGGDSADPITAAHVKALAAKLAGPNARVMVSLDSDHSAAHVRQEIELYAPLVSPGCYLVVEDGVLSWITAEQRKRHNCWYEGTPLDAIDQWLKDQIKADAVDIFPFQRDFSIEDSYPATMNPAGWWRRYA